MPSVGSRGLALCFSFFLSLEEAPGKASGPGGVSAAAEWGRVLRALLRVKQSPAHTTPHTHTPTRLLLGSEVDLIITNKIIKPEQRNFSLLLKNKYMR